MDELKKQAEELGIKVDGRWSEERLQAEVDEVLLAQMSAEEEQNAREAAEAKEREDQEAADKAAKERADKEAEEARMKQEREDQAKAESEAQLKALAEEQENESFVITNLQANPMRSLGLEAYGEAVMPGHVASEPRMALKIERAKALGLIKVK